MGDPAERRATYQDVLEVPPHRVAEVLNGRLYTHARPRLRHGKVSTQLGGRLNGFDEDGGDGPGGWWIVFEPELHLGDDILVPDIAAWRVGSLPEIPDDAFLTVAPDWVCEVLSPSTEAIDRADKVPIYARESVEWVWLVDPEVRTLEVFRLDGGAYRVHAVHRDDAVVRAEPFHELELPLSRLWGRRPAT